MKLEPMADYLGRLMQAAQPYGLLVESPIIAKTQEEQIANFKKAARAGSRTRASPSA